MTAVLPLVRLPVLAVALALLCSGPALATEVPPPAHVDLVDYPTPQANWNAFRDLRRRLENAFDDVCPDTFCEGEYSDYEPMKLRCSVELATGRVNGCAWAFAASELQVDPATGALLHQQPTWLCRIPIGGRTSVASLLASLDGPQPLFQSLPGTRLTVFDALADCLR
ncbi:hypothetical protein [uncultured Stenotrophomonas sp.]|uniref:hypothetical protein n=1 Tax=uncultured Stenotrophomonas sp. TaxID=165438 RepID=UPI0028EC4D9E|nr:hypothetical protein [uncultured Stenotrophomonas sp.]